MKSLFTKALLLMLSLCLMSFMTVAQGRLKEKLLILKRKNLWLGRQ